jgi:hypothetical protein
MPVTRYVFEVIVISFRICADPFGQLPKPASDQFGLA